MKHQSTLPALAIKVSGSLSIASNLPLFGEGLRRYIGQLPANPSTDQEFAETETACKTLKRAEDALGDAENEALEQLAGVNAMRNLVAEYKALARTTRLEREKLVALRKESIKGELVAGGIASLRAFVAELNASMPGAYMPAVPVDFGGAIKSLRTVESIRNAVDSELARAKIEALRISRQIHQNIGAIAAANAPHLFSDTAALVLKGTDDVLNVISIRTNQEAERIRAAAERIRAEEAARLEREAAQAKARSEAEAQRERARIIAQAEAEARAAAAAERERERIRLAEVERVEQAAAVVEPADSPMPVVEPEQQVQAEQHRRMSLWSINLRLSPLEVNYKTLESLGFHATYATSRATHADYLASDFSKICQAISDHALAAATKKATP